MDGKYAYENMLDYDKHYLSLGINNTTTHLLEGLKQKQNADKSLARMWKNKNSHSLLLGIQNGIATMESNLAVSRKAKYSLICF